MQPPPMPGSGRTNSLVDSLALHLQSGAQSTPTELCNLCISIARRIDDAVANDQVMHQAQDLPALLKQVCQRRNDRVVRAAIMVLMFSVKHACEMGWFQENETQQLYTLADEIRKNFVSHEDITAVTSISVIPTVMSRFYPLMKMGEILASLEAKLGYGAHAIDFHISKNAKYSQDEKIYLFVAQTDNTETSACIMNPQQVNFLLNGKAVKGRTNAQMDTGPQMPTDVTWMLNYGTNLLQAVGEFNGHYIIVVAFMSMTPLTDDPVLQKYVESSAGRPDPDSDLIEGPSRVSLNCVLSFTRIKIPVRGHSCKHHQCFDYRNFIQMNMRNPSWRCPHCGQHLCYNSLRIDQNMAKVLMDVGDDVSHVIISADGSWKAMLETDENESQKLNYPNEKPNQQEAAAASTGVPMVMDLTANDGMDTVDSIDIEDGKPFQTTLQSPPATSHGSVLSGTVSDAQMVSVISEPADANNMASLGVTVAPPLNLDVGIRGSANAISGLQNQFYSNLQLHQLQFSSATGSNEFGGSLSTHNPEARTPAAGQAMSARPQVPVLQQRSGSHLNPVGNHGSPFTSPVALSMPPAVDDIGTSSRNMNWQRQHPGLHNMAPSTLQHPGLHNMAPTTWQHPGLHNMAPSTLQHPGLHNMAPTTLQHPRLHNMAPTTLQHPRLHNMAPTTLQHQNQSRQDGFLIQYPWLHPQAVNRQIPSQQAGVYVAYSGFHGQTMNLHQHQNIWMLPPAMRPPSVEQSSPQLPQAQVQQDSAQVGVANLAWPAINQYARFWYSTHAQLPTQMSRQLPSGPVQIQTPTPESSRQMCGNVITSHQVAEQQSGGDPGSIANSVTDEHNWRPSGRMRGSLTGQAYASALGESIIRPTHVSQVQSNPNTNISASTNGIGGARP